MTSKGGEYKNIGRELDNIGGMVGKIKIKFNST